MGMDFEDINSDWILTGPTLQTLRDKISHTFVPRMKREEGQIKGEKMINLIRDASRFKRTKRERTYLLN